MQPTTAPETLHVSMFRNAFDTAPAVRTFTWQQLTAGWASTRRTLNKETRSREIGLMSPATFVPAYRKKENVVEISVLILDIDCGVSVEQIFTRLKRYDCFVVETFHSTPEAPRWRVLIRLVAPIAAADYDAAWARVNRLLGGWLDPATKDASRMLFLTCAAPDAPKRRYFVQEGVALDWRKLKEAAQPAPRERRGSTRPGEHEDRRAAGMLSKWVDELSQQVPGSRRARLMQVAAAAGGLVANGLLDPANARQSLLAACDVNGLTAPPSAGGDGEEATERALEDALQHGEAEPWTPADFGDRENWKAEGTSGSVRLGRRNGRVTREVLEEFDEPKFEYSRIPEFPIDKLPPILREVIDTCTFPPPISFSYALGAIAVALGGGVEIEGAGMVQRAIFWIINVARRGTGKSEALNRVFAPITRYQHHGLENPNESRLTLDNTTWEAFQRELSKSNGEISIVYGQLDAFLASLGQYKRSPTPDQAALLETWTGSPMAYVRVGSKPGMKNGVRIFLERPAISLIGGMEPQMQDLLGPIGSGMRSRWLPFYSGPLDPSADRWDHGLPEAFKQRLGQLLDLRELDRTWMFVPGSDAEKYFNETVRTWREHASAPGQNESIAAMLTRGDTHLQRMSLALAEAVYPGCSGQRRADVPLWVVDAARYLIEFSANCWPVIDTEGEALALTLAERLLDERIEKKLLPKLESYRSVGRVSARDLYLAHVGTHNRETFDKLIARYAANHPGCVVKEGKTTWVCPPPRTGRNAFEPPVP